MIWRRFSLRRIALVLSGVLVAAQALIITVLGALAEVRKRRAPPASFPHVPVQVSTVDSNEVSIFVYGQELYDAMLDAIDGAQHTIYFETFIWKGDQLGQAFKAHLERKAAEGVRVYVIYDGFANLVVPPSFKRFSPQIHVLEYRALEHAHHVIDPRRYARDHRKLLIVDERVAFIGGFNIGKLYATEWRDTHLRLRGPAASELAFAFVNFWNANCGQDPELDVPSERPWPQSITVHRNEPERLLFPIRGMFLDAIDRAQRNIYLTNAYFIPDRAVLQALIAAAQRGVDVRVLLPWQSNHVTADWLARGFFTACLKGGVRLFAYQKAMIHAKTATIDGLWSTIGTANFDRLSLAGNYEVNVEIRDRAIAKEMERIYMVDLSNARELTLAEWERRPWYSRLSEFILSPLWPLL
ncbi:MAG TPA: phospholipase D-like domain-containing protein [Roseiflexaceae bacterium]|jgi:cardiolipin synthase|nr:phospholipase D-like domain-containing protein [Roseiflexaceae bacterium]